MADVRDPAPDPSSADGRDTGQEDAPSPTGDSPAPARGGGGRGVGVPGVGLPLALQFLTVLPVRMPQRGAGAAAPDMGRALAWFPLVGALVGLAQLALDAALAPFFPLAVRDVALLALAALLTGLLHLDGFIDCCDALLGSRSVERRLAILRDSRVGAYGVAGGALLLLGRYAALGALAGGPRALALVLAPLVGRWAMVLAVARYPYVRPAGAGAPFRGGGGGRLVAATLWALALVAGLSPWLLAGRPALGALALGLLLGLVALNVVLLWCRWAAARLGGGLTGDTYGALNELVELAALVLTPPLARLVLGGA